MDKNKQKGCPRCAHCGRKRRLYHYSTAFDMWECKPCMKAEDKHMAEILAKIGS